jgi:hypothetical protein
MKGLAERNILITGIPRSGTTLLTALLDYPPVSVAIGEPQGLGAWQKQYANDHIGFVKKLIEIYSDTRDKIANRNPIKDRVSLNGKPLTNYIENGMDCGRSKSFKITDRLVENVDEDFYLIFKAPVIFTAVLPAILAAKSFKVVAIVRNPISTILSWNSVDFPISNGRLPAGELYWTELGKVAAMDCSVLEKQVRIWELFARRYLDYEKEITFLRYEDLVKDPDSASKLLKIPFASIEIKNMNDNPIYDNARGSDIKEALTKFSPTARSLYL